MLFETFTRMPEMSPNANGFTILFRLCLKRSEVLSRLRRNLREYEMIALLDVKRRYRCEKERRSSVVIMYNECSFK